jgi:predicted secreted hydrolase
VLLALVVSVYAQTYEQALPGYRFEFPRDYFNHEPYQTEWWYYTGNVRAKDGHRFGFELTFFRQGVSRAAKTNAWAVDDVWMAHLALSDVDGQKFHYEERLNRAGPGLAGVDAPSGPLLTGTVWNGNWQAQIGEKSEQLRGVGEDFEFDLKLAPDKPPVVQGQNGVSQKAAGAGRASHYYSLTRLETAGSIVVARKSYQVEGTSWMDHEYFSGAMAADETGWDWLSVQLEDGTELMLYRLRHSDGSIDAYSSGSYVDAKGASQFLASHDFAMSLSGELWTSAATKAKYPERWHVSVPGLKLELDVTTPLRDQELQSTVGPSYWEGAVDVNGMRAGTAVKGVGYLEMTGYAGAGK